MSLINRSLFSHILPLNLILGFGSIFLSVGFSYKISHAQDSTSTTMNCYIKSGFQIYNDENQTSAFDSITPNGKTLCRSVGNNMYLIKFNGRNLYVEASAVKNTSGLKPAEAVQPLETKASSTVDASSAPIANSVVSLRRTGNTPAIELAGQKTKVLPGKWVPVRAEPNQDSRFECPIEIVNSRTSSQAKSICSKVESIDSAIDLTLTGQRVFDKDNKNWYVEASFEHDGRTFVGWFDEKQTTLNPNEEYVRSQTLAERTQETWATHEIGLSSNSSYTLDTTEISYNERAKLLFSLQADPAAFKTAKQSGAEPEDEPTEHTTKYGPPVCGCVGRACRVSSGYGPRKSFRTSNGRKASSNHKAWDISSGTGTPIVAISDGRVISAGWKSGWGRTIEVDHGDGLIVRYSHLDSYTIKSGKVKRGQQIATMGSSGNVTGTHLDIGFKLNGVSKNPSEFISGKSSFLNQSCGAVR